MNKIRGKIVGNSATTPMKVPDWNQNDERKADYIKNRTHYTKTTVLGECHIPAEYNNPDYTDGGHTCYTDKPLEESKVYRYNLCGEEGTVSWSIIPDDTIGSITDDDGKGFYYNPQALSILFFCQYDVDVDFVLYDDEIKVLDEKYLPKNMARLDTIVPKIEYTTNGFKATFPVILEVGMQLFYDYTANGNSISGMAKPIKLNSDNRLEVSIGDKYHTDFALKGIAYEGSSSMTFTFIENVNYSISVKELSIPKPIPFKFLGISKGLNLGFNSEIKENSLNSNNFGSSNSIEGEHNNTFGTGNTIQAKTSTIFGQDSTIAANLCYLFGDKNKSIGRCNVGFGSLIEMSGTNSGAIGFGLKANGDYQLVAGKYNVEDKDALLVMGYGSDDANRKNVFVVKNDGKIYVNEKPFTLLSETDKTKLNSFNSTGVDNSNTGRSSAQLGFKNNNSYDNVIQLGRENVSGGQYVYQIGYGNQSLSGQEYLFGKKLLSSEWEQIVVGKFNENVNDAIFVVGNGTSDTSRSNAIIVKKNNDAYFTGDIYSKGKKVLTSGDVNVDVNALNDEIASLKARVQALEDERIALNDSISFMYSDFNAIYARLDALENK